MTDQQESAAAALRAADASRAEILNGVRVPGVYYAGTVLYWALFVVALTGWWVDPQQWRRTSMMLFLLATGVAIGQGRWFRRTNGVSLRAMSALQRERPLLAKLVAPVAYFFTLVAAYAAGEAGYWWLVGVVAVSGGIAQALVIRSHLPSRATRAV